MRLSLGLTLSAAAVTSAAWLAPAPADACSCAPGSLYPHSPLEGAVGVPTNVSLWVESHGEGAFTLSADDGTEVPVTVSHEGPASGACSGSFYEITPVPPLAANTAYTLYAPATQTWQIDGELHFTTGDGPLKGSPDELSEVEVVALSVPWESSCGDSGSLCVRTDAPADALVLVTPVDADYPAIAEVTGDEALALYGAPAPCYQLEVRSPSGARSKAVEVCDIPVVDSATVGLDDGYPTDDDCEVVFAAAARGDTLQGFPGPGRDAGRDAGGGTPGDAGYPWGVTAEDGAWSDAGTRGAPEVASSGKGCDVVPSGFSGAAGGAFWLFLSLVAVTRQRRARTT